MRTDLSRHSAWAIACCLVLHAATARAQAVFDTFEEYATGSFPGLPWAEAAAAADQPSGSVEVSTGPATTPTQVFRFQEKRADVQGIIRPIVPSSRYYSSAEVRIDRFASPSGDIDDDWAFQIGVGLSGGATWYSSPQVAVFASNDLREWALIAIRPTAPGSGTSVSLGFPALSGVWYRVEMDLDAKAGLVTTRIRNLATAQLFEAESQIPGWTPEDGAFDTLLATEGDHSGSSVTNQVVVDNVVFRGAGQIPSLSVAARSALGLSLLLVLCHALRVRARQTSAARA